MRKVVDKLKLNVPMQFMVRYKWERKLFHAAAKRDGKKFSAWVRDLILARIAEQEEEKAA